MYQVTVSVTNLDESTNEEFREAAAKFVENLQSVSDLQVEVSTQQIKGTRGDLILLNEIFVRAVELGVLGAIYTFAKDFMELYANAEVDLVFKDGSRIRYKHLTSKEAYALLEAHLKNSTK